MVTSPMNEVLSAYDCLNTGDVDGAAAILESLDAEFPRGTMGTSLQQEVKKLRQAISQARADKPISV